MSPTICWRDNSKVLDMSALPATTGMLLVGDGIEVARGLPGDFESERGGDSTLDWSMSFAYDCALNAELCGRLVVNALNSSAVSLLCCLDAGKRESSGRRNICWALTVDDERG